MLVFNPKSLGVLPIQTGINKYCNYRYIFGNIFISVYDILNLVEICARVLSPCDHALQTDTLKVGVGSVFQ